MKKASLIITAIVVLLVVGGGAFWSGMVYAQSQSVNTAAAARANFAEMRGNRTGVSGTNFTSGYIISKDSNSITLQLPNSTSSKIIFYSDSTQIGKMASGTSADLATGTSVSVTGTTNSDGSITAQSIQIRPAGMNPGGINRPATGQ